MECPICCGKQRLKTLILCMFLFLHGIYRFVKLLCVIEKNVFWVAQGMPCAALRLPCACIALRLPCACTPGCKPACKPNPGSVNPPLGL